MAKEKGLGSVKRFGVRYGRTVKRKLAVLEAEYKRKHKCPYCHYDAVRRISTGIWACGKCGSKFTGKAYTPVIKRGAASMSSRTVDEFEEYMKKSLNKKKKESEESKEENI